ncbi:regulator of G protein signaling domain protein [Teladorsagia circumcincta]|uniref:Regulator of G protein signaling domain protein n=1 Tax=Teladorsagia circumcincta TaxID=45464 RepID=A0A2G9USM3_TELCI|nr:regulator of G protein signaling domain protein [Teladorsagia circumcincta]
MNSVFEKLRKKDPRGYGTEPIVIQNSCVLAQNIDHLLADSSALTFFIQFLECYDKLNLVKFWIHVEGFKASLGEERAECAQDAENSRELSSFIYFKDFENSLFYKKYQLQVFSRRCSLDDILYVPALLNAFLEFVDDRHDHDCLQFLIACNAFEENYDSLSDEEALEDAMSIYDKYFSMQALSPIRIGDTARRRMESEICSDSGRPLLSSFNTAKQYCFLRIHDRYLESFVKSTAYHNFLLELEAEVGNMIELPRPNRQMKCGSSSSDSQAVLLDHHFDIPEFKRVSSGSSQHSPLLMRRNRSL